MKAEQLGRKNHYFAITHLDDNQEPTKNVLPGNSISISLRKFCQKAFSSITSLLITSPVLLPLERLIPLGNTCRVQLHTLRLNGTVSQKVSMNLLLFTSAVHCRVGSARGCCSLLLAWPMVCPLSLLTFGRRLVA